MGKRGKQVKPAVALRMRKEIEFENKKNKKKNPQLFSKKWEKNLQTIFIFCRVYFSFCYIKSSKLCIWHRIRAGFAAAKPAMAEQLRWRITVSEGRRRRKADEETSRIPEKESFFVSIRVCVLLCYRRACGGRQWWLDGGCW